MCPIRVYKTERLKLLAIGAVSKIISIRLLSQMEVEPSPTRKTITVANDVQAMYKGLVGNVSVLFSYSNANLDLSGC